MEAVRVITNPIINLLVDDKDDTNNPVLEVQVSADDREIFQQIVLHSEFELNQAEEVHKLIVFHSPRDPNQKIAWLEDLDDDAFATADHDPYERNPYEQGSEKPVFGPEPPPKQLVPKECYLWDADDLDLEERLAREFEEQENRREQQK